MPRHVFMKGFRVISQMGCSAAVSGWALWSFFAVFLVMQEMCSRKAMGKSEFHTWDHIFQVHL